MSSTYVHYSTPSSLPSDYALLSRYAAAHDLNMSAAAQEEETNGAGPSTDIEDYEDELDQSAFAPPDEGIRNSSSDREPIAAEGSPVTTSGPRGLEHSQQQHSPADVERTSNPAQAAARGDIGFWTRGKARVYRSAGARLRGRGR